MATERLRAAARTVLPEPVYRPIRRWWLSRIVQGYEERVVTHRYGRRELSILLADPLGEGWYDRDCKEPTELALLAQGQLRPGATVFDLGSHQAVVALMLADRIGPTGRVIAVEATPHNHLVSKRNLALNAATNVVPLHAAVARMPGTLRFMPELNGRIGTQRRLGTVGVRAVSIDSLTEEFGAPDVVFIDIEGHELAALAGASRTLLGKPDLFVEVHQGVGLEDAGGSAREVVDTVQAAGYSRLLVSLDDGAPFVPIVTDGQLPAGRFLLVAQAA